MRSLESQSTAMSGWDTQNNAFHQWTLGRPPNGAAPAPTAGNVPIKAVNPSPTAHDDFVTKYLQCHSIASHRSILDDASFQHQVSHNRRSGILFTSPPQAGVRGVMSSSAASASLQLMGPSFCNRDNLEQCVSFIDQEITVLGFPSLYSSASDRGQSSESFDIVQLVNCCYELVQRHHQSLRKLEQQETKQMRCDSDLEHLQSNHNKLKEQLEGMERENVALTEKERQQLNRTKAVGLKLKNTQEELKKLESIVKHRDTQFKHDLKKREREVNKMKERIHQLLMDKNQERRIGMDILNSLQRTDGKRATWKTGKTGSKHEEEMYRVIITNYEERQKETILENQVLRESLSNMQKELVDLLNRQGDKGMLSSNNNESDDDTTSIDSNEHQITHGHFQMPYQMVREGIETSLKQKWQKLKEHIQRMENNKENSAEPHGDGDGRSSSSTGMVQDAPPIEVLEDEIARLQDKVKDYHNIIEQQDQVLQSVQDTNVDDNLMSLLKDSQLLEEKECLAEEKRMFYQQKVSFEKERRNFTEAAIRLGHERKKFEDERGSFLQQQMMTSPSRPGGSSLPLRPAKSINTSSSPGGNQSDHSPQTPPSERTPLSHRHQRVINTPTTVELYRALKLIPDRGECLNSSRESLHAPSYYSDSDQQQSGTSTPRSGVATPRSVGSHGSTPAHRPSSSSSQVPGTGGGRRGSGQTGKASGSGRSGNLRNQHGHRTTKGEGPGKWK